MDIKRQDLLNIAAGIHIPRGFIIGLIDYGFKKVLVPHTVTPSEYATMEREAAEARIEWEAVGRPEFNWSDLQRSRKYAVLCEKHLHDGGDLLKRIDKAIDRINKNH